MATKEQIEAYKKISNRTWHTFTELLARAEKEQDYKNLSDTERDEKARFWAIEMSDRFNPIRDDYYGTPWQKFAEDMVVTFLFELERIRGGKSDYKV